MPKVALGFPNRVAEMPRGCQRGPKGVPERGTEAFSGVSKEVPEMPNASPEKPNGVPEVLEVVPRAPRRLKTMPKDDSAVPKGGPELPKVVLGRPENVPEICKGYSVDAKRKSLIAK